MKKAQVIMGIAIATLATAAIPVFAQSQTDTRPRSFSTELSGRVIGVGNDEFLLQTLEGQILVDAEDRQLRRADLIEGEEITVTGYYDEGEFEAYTIIRPNGNVIQVWD